MPDFDPFSPFVAADGLEYVDLAHAVIGQPVDCPRNDVIRSLKDHPSVQWSDDIAPGEWIAAQYYHQDRAGNGVDYPRNDASIRHRPQLWDRHCPGFPNHRRPEGAGQPDLGAPPAATVRAEGEPEVQRGLGA